MVSFEVHGTVVNLIDTPGHPGFIAEVERVLEVLDGVVLVISAVEGVQAQTRVLMRTLRRLGHAGCTVNFALCVDVNTRSDNPVIGDRGGSRRCIASGLRSALNRCTGSELQLPAETPAATLAMLAEVRAVPQETTPQVRP